MLETRARRIPLVDIDDDTRRQMVCSVITQYRILKFISVNVHDTQLLRKPLRQIKLGTTRSLEVCKMDTPVINVINQMVRKNISCVPILNTDGKQRCDRQPNTILTRLQRWSSTSSRLSTSSPSSKATITTTFPSPLGRRCSTDQP